MDKHESEMCCVINHRGRISCCMSGAKEAIWLHRLLSNITSVNSKCPALYMDNANVIKLAKNCEFHKRSKHIEVNFHFILEKCKTTKN